MTFNKEVDTILKDISQLLKHKNKAYGNSALKPANIFSKQSAIDSLCARIYNKSLPR